MRTGLVVSCTPSEFVLLLPMQKFPTLNRKPTAHFKLNIVVLLPCNSSFKQRRQEKLCHKEGNALSDAMHLLSPSTKMPARNSRHFFFGSLPFSINCCFASCKQVLCFWCALWAWSLGTLLVMFSNHTRSSSTSLRSKNLMRHSPTLCMFVSF